MSWTLCTTASATAKAGVNVSAALLADATALARYSDDAEGTFCMKTRRDWITTVGGTQIMNAVADAVSDLVAMKMIGYDTTGYLKGEATLMLNVLKDNSDMVIKDLREDQYQELNK